MSAGSRPPRQVTDDATLHPVAQIYQQQQARTLSKLDRAIVVDTTTNAVTASGTFSGTFRPTTNSQTGAYVAVAGDAGKVIASTTGGLTLNASVFTAGDVLWFYNNSAVSQNITAGAGVTFRLMGTATSTSPRAVARAGFATIYAVSATEFAIGGPGVT